VERSDGTPLTSSGIEPPHGFGRECDAPPAFEFRKAPRRAGDAVLEAGDLQRDSRARFADRIILLFGDGRWSAGPVREVLTAQSLSALYNSPMIEIEKDGRRVFVNG